MISVKFFKPLFLVLLIPVFFLSMGNKQQLKQPYEVIIISSDSITNSFGKQLQEYVKGLNYKLSKNYKLDSLAELRAKYFISLLTTENTLPISQLIDSIPRNKDGHNRYFGKPYLYTEEPGIPYPELNVKFPAIKSRVHSEIMQQHLWQLSSSKEYNNGELLNKALSAFAANSTTDFILNTYKSSKDHKNTIDSSANGYYGGCTKVCISSKRNEGNYKYYVVIYNVTIFSRPYQ